MTKFSQIATNTAPTDADYLVGVTAGNVDGRFSFATILAWMKAKTAWITSAMIDFTTFGDGNYSTSETNTGFKWIDGKAIYKQTFSVTTGTGTSEQIFDIALDLATTRIIKVEGGQQNSAPDYYPLEYVNPGAATLQNMQLKISRLAGTPNKWQIRCNTGSAGSLIVTVYFTK